ncbi:MAG: adenylosuccinate synthase [Candidatus Burarchaeum sp.]|nr:adenylosuccinate synthase [Candidatus Burarchaeum sp.]MDO8339208.1 adenylosuccinate synthase [Candidatus Burarchaeum sp.]
MPGAVVVGLQYGDEGKGKVVDYCAQKADIVVRFNGGANAGHTVIVKGETHKFHLMPSGVLWGKRVMLGAGTVIDPKLLLDEIAQAQKAGIKPKLLVDYRAHVVTPWHKLLDGASEVLKGRQKIGTTGRGIGPAYADKVSRIGIRVGDLLDAGKLREKTRFLNELNSKIASRVYSIEEVPQDFTAEYAEYGRQLAPYVGMLSIELNMALSEGRKVLFEGAQGAQLDVDLGTYPYVTSSNTTAGAACAYCGVGPKHIKEVLGVVKAYTSRVGEGPFVSEINGHLADKLREKGKEYGTTTGRPRRIGWLNLVAVRYAAMINGTTGLAVTKLDTLSGLEKINVCKEYECEGKMVGQHKADAEFLKRCKPVYIELKGWEDPGPAGWRAMVKNGYNALPKECKNYLKLISEFCNAPIYMVSIGPGREDTILLKNLF